MIPILILHIFYLKSLWTLAEPKLPEGTELPSILPGICFVPDESSLEWTKNQNISCVLATAGQYPPLQKTYNSFFERCCFYGDIPDGTFWAIGESVISPVMTYARNSDSQPFRTPKTPFNLQEAHLIDILVLDGATDAPVHNVRVTLSDDAVHLVSYSKNTDEDGYAVFPLLAETKYVATLRADGYLPPSPIQIEYRENDESERIVELDPGIELSGTVFDVQGHPAANAQLHVEIDRPNGSIWSSEIDLPRPISAVTDGTGWSPYRGSYSTSDTGRFKLQTLPRGKIRIFATHDKYVPSPWIQVDASDNGDLQPVALSLQSPHQAWIRVEDEHQIAIASTLTVIDAVTLHEISTHKTSTSGTLELKSLPRNARFSVISEEYAPVQVDREVHDGDEITIVLTQKRADSVNFTTLDEDNNPVQNVTISPFESAVRKNHPTCLGKTDSEGITVVEFCPKAFWIDVFHPDYVHYLQYISPDAPIKLQLAKGRDIEIEMIDQKTRERIPDVTCTTEVSFESEKAVQTLAETFTSTDGIMRLYHRGQQLHRMTCHGGPGQETTLDFLPENAPKQIEFPHLLTRKAIVLDAFGSPVPYARIQQGDIHYETDETGRIELRALPDTALSIRHWLHGSMTAIFMDGASELELRLPDTIDQDVISCLNSLGLPYITDSAQILIDASDPKHGILRGDSVESCTGKKLVIVREGRRMDVKM